MERGAGSCGQHVLWHPPWLGSGRIWPQGVRGRHIGAIIGTHDSADVARHRCREGLDVVLHDVCFTEVERVGEPVLEVIIPRIPARRHKQHEHANTHKEIKSDISLRGSRITIARLLVQPDGHVQVVCQPVLAGGNHLVVVGVVTILQGCDDRARDGAGEGGVLPIRLLTSAPSWI
jgi:hypothetical protein